MKESCRNVIYVSSEDGEMATSVWLNKYFGQEIAKDDRLSKLKYVYNTEGIIKNLREVVSTNCVDLIIIDSYADLFTGSMNNSKTKLLVAFLTVGLITGVNATVSDIQASSGAKRLGQAKDSYTPSASNPGYQSPIGNRESSDRPRDARGGVMAITFGRKGSWFEGQIAAENMTSRNAQS